MPLDNEFEYTGQSILIKMCYFRPTAGGGSSAFTFFGTRDTALAFQINSSYAVGMNNMTCGDNTIHPDFANYPAADIRPNFRFGINGQNGSEFKAANAFHTNYDTIAAGGQHVEILGTKIEIHGKNGSPHAFLTTMNFDGKTANINYNGQVINARLYYTGNSPSFSRGQQVGQQITISSTNDLNSMTFNLIDNNPNGFRLDLGDHYF